MSITLRNMPAQRPPIQATASADPAQYLTFMLGGETFAIGILSIKEIIEYGQLTSVPLMPASVRGVINLRGAVVPVVDLQVRFGRESSEVTKRTCIVIIEFGAPDEHHVVGAIVDAVNEVLDIPSIDIEPAPALGVRIQSDIILGMGKVRGKFVILLDVARALLVDEIAAIDAATGAESITHLPSSLAIAA